MNEPRTAGAERVEIAIIGAQRPRTLEMLEARFHCHHIYAEADPLAKLKEVGPRIRGAASNGMAGITKAQLELMPNLEIVAINGVGLETTDREGCIARGVTVCIAPVLYDDVADLAIALALAACRRIVQADRYLREGHWLEARFPLARKLTGMKAGLIGLGRIGAEVAQRLEGFKCDIAYTDPVPREVAYARAGDAVALAERSDILFLAAAGAPKGAAPPIVTREIIEALGPRGVFINVARGWLVDEPALIAALKEGRLGAAGLDVFDDEPNVPKELIDLDNVVLTPHIASSTEETMGAMGECVVGNLASWFEGEGALTPAW